jgi:hypothetical protein
MLKRNYRMLAIFLVIALTLACAPAAVVTPPPAIPTIDLLSLNTTIAQTAGAAATQTFVLLPTSTPTLTATRTPTEVPSSTPTFLYVLASPTVPLPTPTLDISAGPYACTITSQTPGENAVFSRKALFDAHWLVVNTGAYTWDANSADYRFISGDKLHDTAAYDGTYSTKWMIALGKERFCPMKVTIVVN